MIYAKLALALGLALSAGWVGYRVGETSGAQAVAAEKDKVIEVWQQAAVTASTTLDAHVAEEARQAKLRDAKALLDKQLWDDLNDYVNKNAANLSAARKRIKDLSHAQQPIADLLSTPIPDELRRAAGEAAHPVH